MFSRGTKVTAFQGGNIIFGSTMLMISLGWATGFLLKTGDVAFLALPIVGVLAITISQWVFINNHFVSSDQANLHMFAAQSQNTSDSYPSLLWLILPISVLIMILAKLDFKKYKKHLENNKEKYTKGGDGFEGGEVEDNFSRI
jgi:hypothetical protein